MHIWCVCLVTLFYLTLYPIIYSVHIISFRECIERSNVLDWEEQEDIPSSVLNQQNNVNVKFHRLVLRPNTHFIYGVSDTVDKESKNRCGHDMEPSDCVHQLFLLTQSQYFSFI